MRRGTREYRRASLAMLAVGLAIFNSLYATQALLPLLVADLRINPTQAALTVSAATGALAIFIVPFSILSERFGRGRILVISALSATAVGLCLPLAPNATWLILMRAVHGALIAGTPAVAMTWLAEEIHPKDLAGAMGLYIAGNTIGGLTGRLIPSAMVEITTWRWALFTSAAVAFAFAIIMVVLLPTQKNFRPKSITFGGEFRAMISLFRHPQLIALFATAFVGMGVFVSMYNFIGFRLTDTFGLPASLAGLVFIMYLSGTWSSARAGTFVKRYGRGRVVGAGATLMLVGALLGASSHLWVTVIGLFVFTASFFAMHSTASGWVGLVATRNRAEASSMYLFSYYVGSSVLGALTGYAFEHLTWLGFIGTLSTLLIVLVLIAVWLLRSERRSH